jgi:hypothetical protein
MVPCTIIVGEMSPGFRVVAILLLVIGAGKKMQKRWTTLGFAQWAEVDDLRRAGMLGKSGLISIGDIEAACGRRP